MSLACGEASAGFCKVSLQVPFNWLLHAHSDPDVSSEAWIHIAIQVAIHQAGVGGRCSTRAAAVAAAMSQPRLPRRPLGRTGLEASVLSFGASPLGSVFEVDATTLSAMSPDRCQKC